MKREHLGYHTKTIRSSSGPIESERRYEKCRTCGPVHHVDAFLGLEDYSAGFRFLAVRAGSKDSFKEAEKDMKAWRGLEVSHETIRMLCHQEAPKVKEFFEKSDEVPKDFIAARGNVEFLMDAAKVNTLKGWRDIKIGIFSKRLLGYGVDISQWDNRDRKMLPDVNAAIAFAAIEEKEFFQVRVNRYRSLLHVGSTGDISALGDGAEWIWNIVRYVFGNVRECLDIYHALEHLSNTGKALYKEGTVNYKLWREMTKWELLESGFEKIEMRLNELERELKKDDTQKQKRTAIDSLRRYLENHKSRLGYCERLAQGRVIGSGQVEGACKTMVGKRLKQTGARWDVDRLNEMAVLCSVHYSNLWEKYWIQAN
jgi:hypothetical protein